MVNFNRTLVSFTLIFLISVSVYAADVSLPADGKVPGTPFQALQQQIDQLKLQLENIQLTPGPQGPAGPEGPMGPSDAFATYLEVTDPPIQLPPGELITVAKLYLPQGNYVYSAHVTVRHIGADTATIQCSIGPGHGSGADMYAPGGEALVTLTLTGESSHEMSDFILLLNCVHNNLPPTIAELEVTNFNLQAIKVGTLTYQP